jgi:hypothetical protein
MPDHVPSDVKGSLLAYDEAQTRGGAAMAEMTDMQRKYVEARLSGMIPLHAGRAAGMSMPEVNAYRMEKHPRVQRALGSARQMLIEKFDVNRDDVLRGMFDAVQASGSATELVAAWREIGRIIGAYEPSKLEVMHRIEDVTLDKLQRLSTKELIELAEGDGFTVEADVDPYADEYAQVLRVSTLQRVGEPRGLRPDGDRHVGEGRPEEEGEDAGGEASADGDMGAEDSQDVLTL